MADEVSGDLGDGERPRDHPDWSGVVNPRGQVTGRRILLHLAWTTALVLGASLWWYGSGLA